jgi:hypothetical protein
MPSLTDTLIILVGSLIFLIVLFLYVDVKVGMLRKEMLAHYALVEKLANMISPQQRLQSNASTHGYGTGNPDYHSIFPKVIQAPVDEDFIPSKEEMSEGLMHLETMNRDNEDGRKQAEVGHSQFGPVDPWEHRRGPYAPFDPSVFQC